MHSSVKDKFNPKERYAICDAKFATIYNGRRVVNFYRSGQPLTGQMVERQNFML